MPKLPACKPNSAAVSILALVYGKLNDMVLPLLVRSRLHFTVHDLSISKLRNTYSRSH